MSFYTLSGDITTKQIEATNPNFVHGYDLSKLNNINEVWSELNSKGTLRIKDGVYLVDENVDKMLLTFHMLELDNATIITNSSNLTILCNEFKFNNAQILSFDKEAVKVKKLDNTMQAGENGKDGKDGLDGGNVTFFTTDKIHATGRLKIHLGGQDGGDGTDGADGAKGATGARGRNCSDGGYQCKRDCGNGHKGGKGQKGGDGGQGGDGGNGGKFDFRFHGYQLPNEFIFDFTGKGGHGGNGGYAGAGGAGGTGGRAGAMGCGAFCHGRCYPGPTGDRGENGINGQSGQRGADNYLVNANFDIQYLKTYLTAISDKKLLKTLMNTAYVFSADLEK